MVSAMELIYDLNNNCYFSKKRWIADIWNVPHLRSLFIGFTVFLTCIVQAYPYIKDFKVNQISQKMLVSWTTNAGFSCEDIVIEVSRDNEQFIGKATYFGICGDLEEKSYQLMVDSPYYNSVNYLRLNLGTYGYSDTISLFILRIETALLVPMPVNGSATLYFRNEMKQKALIKVYNQQGELIIVEETREAHSSVQWNLAPGLYIYMIELDGILRYRSKFISL
jgi:hypothetical protein